jgi:hypothetical protein
MKKYPSLVPFCNKYPLQRDIFCLEKLRFMYGPLGPVWSFAPYEALLLGWLKLGFGFGEKGNWLALGFGLLGLLVVVLFASLPLLSSRCTRCFASSLS